MAGPERVRSRHSMDPRKKSRPLLEGRSGPGSVPARLLDEEGRAERNCGDGTGGGGLPAGTADKREVDLGEGMRLWLIPHTQNKIARLVEA